MLSGINNNFFFFDLFMFVFTTLKKKIFFFVPSQSTLISQEVFFDYQISLGNTTNLNSSLLGGIFNISGKGKNLRWGDLTFYWGT